MWRRVVAGGYLPGIRVQPPGRGESETNVSVELTVPHLRLRGSPRYRLTTKPMPLDRQGFPSTALRDAISHDASKHRGRALFCWDYRRRLCLAALSFHLDPLPSAPLLITDIAPREDALNALSIFAVWMLFDIAQDIALLEPGRNDAEIGILIPTGHYQARQRVSALGLRPCKRPSSYNDDSLTWYCYPRTRSKVSANLRG